MTDVFFHFALEEYLMQAAGAVSAPLLYLWRPAPVITIGRHQNPWKECVLSQLDADGVALARRRSGGGAVYQDLGCSVFTFISPSDCFSIDRNLKMVLGALRRCGIEGEVKGRNDLTYEGRKISGSAFRHAPDRELSLHHGTILVDTDFKALQRYLTPDKRKLEAKGIKSVAARVQNLRELFPNFDHAAFCDAMVAEFREVEGAQAATLEEVGESSSMVAEPAFQAIRANLLDREWRFGRTPEFSHHLDTRIDGSGVFDVRLNVVGGAVQEAAIFSDALFPEVIDAAIRALEGTQYGRQPIREALEDLEPQFPEVGPRKLLHTFSEWLVTNVDD